MYEGVVEELDPVRDTPPAELAVGEWCGGEFGPWDVGDFFQGWKPLPTAASASGGGDFEESLLHWAASIASGVPRRLGCSCNKTTSY